VPLFRTLVLRPITHILNISRGDQGMKFLLAVEPDAPIDSRRLAALINAHCKQLAATPSSSIVVLRHDVLPVRSSGVLPEPLRAETKRIDAHRALLFTQIPFEDNYFFHEPDSDGLLIVSMYAWDRLTSLPMENGALYFVIKQAAYSLHVPERHYTNTGCIFDFNADKRGVDTGMRAAFLCASCDKEMRVAVSDSAEDRQVLDDLVRLLDVLSRASRAHESIFRMSEALLSGESFDVFMCHNSQDKPAVKRLAHELRSRQIAPWLDEEQIPPGRPWQSVLTDAIPRIRTASVFVGPSGIGPWQDQEIQAFLNEFARRSCPVIPVLLSQQPGAVRPELPLFLRNYMWIEQDSDAFFERLVWGITGKRVN